MTATAIAITPLIVLLAAFAIWTLANLAQQERWLLFTAALLFFLPIGIWLAWQEKPLPTSSDLARLLLSGSIVTVALFLPLWVFGIIFLLMIGMEVKAILYEKVGDDLYIVTSQLLPDNPYPEWSNLEPAEEPSFREFRIQRAGLLEQLVPAEEDSPAKNESF